MRINERKCLGIIVLTIILFIAITSLFRTKAVAKSECFSVATDTVETEYRMQVKDVLKSYGAAKAGITMTKKCEDGHSYTYNVAIHFPSYINIDSEKEEALRADLEALELDVRDSSVTFSFS